MSSSGTVGTVGVVGAGTMGRGIAQLCAQKGFPVLLHDVSTEAAEKAARVIQDDLSSSATKGALTPEEAAQARSRVRPAAALEELASADIVIEAIFEDLAAKRELFARLEPLLKPRAILATNTSSLAVGAIAEGSPSPGRILGMHFFNPATMMRLIEVVRAPLTEEGAFRRAWAFALELGKTPVEAKDTPGFIVNRVVRPFYLQAQSVAGEGGTSFERIDNEVRDLGGLPMGPFKLMDLIGLDVNLAISRSIYQALKKPERLKPHFIQERLVEAGRNGRKTGKGFYLYENGRSAGTNPEALNLIPSRQITTRPGDAWRRIRDAIIREAELARDEGVASESDIDTAVRLAMNFPKGPFELRREREAGA